jgi:hypothetical protein
VLREIAASRNAAHFSVVSVLGHGDFGYVFKVQYCTSEVDATSLCDVREQVLVRERHVRCVLCQVRCTHPRHPLPRKQYALKLAINYDGRSWAPSIERLYGGDSRVLRRLPVGHPNLCSLLAEFVGAVPDDIFAELRRVRWIAVEPRVVLFMCCAPRLRLSRECICRK